MSGTPSMVWTSPFFDRLASVWFASAWHVVKLDGPAFERDAANERVSVHAEGPRPDVLA